jgi:pSer/pThr/pTyr-binding forkhead associated (FHA) protein
MSQTHVRGQPSLVVLHGSAANKVRPIDQDVLTVGRARGADIGLDAPDVSSLHCVIWRGATGYLIRDCGSRAGTRVNGDVIRESLLHDGDVLQIGPFSFRVQMPAGAFPLAPREARYNHVEHSRRNLARLALALRQKIRIAKLKNSHQLQGV